MKNIISWDSFNENSSNDIDVKNPLFTDTNAEDFLIRLGIGITKSSGTYTNSQGESVPQEPNVGIKIFPSSRDKYNRNQSKILYSFKVLKDSENFEKYVSEKGISFERKESEGARYPYQIIIKR